MIRELVTDPQAFFSGKAQDRSVVLELFIVLVVGALGSVGSYYFSQRVFDLAPTGGFSTFQAMGIVLDPVIGIFIFWIGGAGAAHFLSGLYNGRGPIRRLLKLTAWAMVPLAVGNIVRSAVIYLTYNDVPSTIIEDEAVGDFTTQANALRDAVSNDALSAVAMVVLILSVIASWHLLSYAIATAKQIDVADARKVAAVPSGIFVLLLLQTLLGSLGIL